MLFFISGTINKGKVISLILILFIIYSVRTLFKYFYKKEVDQGYYSVKHAVEMYYFKRLEKLDPSSLERINREDLANKILEISFNTTKMISDIFEYMIPLVVGILIYFIVLGEVCFITLLVEMIVIGVIIYFHFKYYGKVEVNNYNDLLKDFVQKLPDIRMLNAFSYCSKKLDKSESNICIIRNNTKNNNFDIVYDYTMLGLLFMSIISVMFLSNSSVDILGLSLFFLFMGIKLKDLLYAVVPTIKNILSYSDNFLILEDYLKNPKQEKYLTDWKKIQYKDAIYQYESGIKITIPNFEFIKGDTVSILGAAGMGKSTLLYLLSGIYNLSVGETYVDGKQTDAKINSMYITRNTKMFKLSLRDNLLLGEKMSDEDLLKLIKEINIKEWYDSLADGLDTIIDINYIDLSDEIREKLNILRGIISTKETLLLDEPTYDLDMESEKIIANMIKKYWKKKSYIIVTHRPIFTTICKKHYFMKNHQLLESEPLL
jgi:ABC-type multidrug transport system fused ATPase/permease subunit